MRILNGQDNLNSTKTQHHTIANVSNNDVVKAIYVGLSNNPGASKSYDFTLHKNGVNTALTVELSGAETDDNFATDISLTDGDLLVTEIDPTNSPSAGYHQVSYLFFEPSGGITPTQTQTATQTQTLTATPTVTATGTVVATTPSSTNTPAPTATFTPSPTPACPSPGGITSESKKLRFRITNPDPTQNYVMTSIHLSWSIGAPKLKSITFATFTDNISPSVSPPNYTVDANWSGTFADQEEMTFTFQNSLSSGEMYAITVQFEGCPAVSSNFTQP